MTLFEHWYPNWSSNICTARSKKPQSANETNKSSDKLKTVRILHFAVFFGTCSCFGCRFKCVYVCQSMHMPYNAITAVKMLPLASTRAFFTARLTIQRLMGALMTTQWLYAVQGCRLYTLCLKKTTLMLHTRFNLHQPISVIFGRDVGETVCYWVVIYYPTSPN